MTTPQSFSDQYADAFAHYDTPALTELFAFPLHVVGIDNNPTALSVAARGEWLPVLGGLLGSYRRLGVAGGVPLELEVAH